MTKGKILGLGNTEDSLWFKLAPEDKTLELLNKIFDIEDNLYEESFKNIFSYSEHIRDIKGKKISKYFHKENDYYIAYLIFTPELAHFILRKTLDWKKYNKEIEKEFEFIDK